MKKNGEVVKFSLSSAKMCSSSFVFLFFFFTGSREHEAMHLIWKFEERERSLRFKRIVFVKIIFATDSQNDK